jgi:hypothetical protein
MALGCVVDISGVVEEELRALMIRDLLSGSSSVNRIRACSFTDVGFLEDLAAWLRGSIPNWRVALPVIAVLAIAVLAMVASRHHPASSVSAPPAVQAVSVSGSESDLSPTIANYQMVANQSLEKLSELLTRQGNKSLPPAPIYTASSLTLADEPF